MSFLANSQIGGGYNHFQRSSAKRSRHFNFIFTAMHLYRIIFGTPLIQRYSFVHDKICFSSGCCSFGGGGYFRPYLRGQTSGDYT